MLRLSLPEAPRPWPPPLDLAALSQTDPQPPPFIIPGWLPAGYATLIAGHGGAGKSGITLHAAVAIATGEPLFGLSVERRRVLYLSCEDRQDVLHWRLTRICEYRGIRMEDLAGHLDVLDLVGHDVTLWTKPDAPATRAFGELRERVKGHPVFVVDGIADVFGGNENSRSEVKGFVNLLVGLIPRDGALLLVGHVSKPTAAGNGGEGYSGSTGWHNSVRARWYLSPEVGAEPSDTTGALLLEVQKSNLGPAGERIRLVWDPDAHLHVGELVRSRSRMDRAKLEVAEQAGILQALEDCVGGGDYCPAATTGQRTAWHVLSTREGFPETLSGASGKRRFWRQIEQLRSMGRISESSIRRNNRHQTAVLLPAGSGNTSVAPNASNPLFDMGRTIDATAPAPNAPNGAGGYRGSARTQPCPRCDGEGCPHCGPGGPAA